MDIKNFTVLIKRLSIVLLAYFICRIIFYLFNQSFFLEASISTIALAFLHGFRFDLAIILTINLPFVFLSIIPIKQIVTPSYQKFIKILFLITNIPMIMLNLIDIEYFQFIKKRTTFDIVGISSDIKDQYLQLLFNYWYIIILCICIIYLLIRLYPKLERAPSLTIPKLDAIVLICAIGGVSIFIIRGGFQLKPLKASHAFILEPRILGNISLNTPFTVLSTFNNSSIERKDFFQSPEEVVNIIHPHQRKTSNKEKKDNVVIIILESFSTEYTGLGNSISYTPFLDSLAKEGVYFKNNFANGHRSIDALPSIMGSIPCLMDVPYMNSSYQNNELNGLGHVLKRKGYHTSFFHGGKNGTMGFDYFSKNAGFENYIGKNEFPIHTPENVSKWGIFDEPFLQFFNKEISEINQPFLSCVFTLSSHQPYTIPDKYQNKFPKGTLEIHESIGYADFALRKFFESAQKESWYKNTLFVLTADHTALIGNSDYNNALGSHKVPLVLFHPNEKFTDVDTSRITQHLDIMPTVLDYLDIDSQAQLLFGKSVFDNTQGLAINYSSNSYRLIQKDYFLVQTPGQPSKLYKYNDLSEKESIINQNAVKDNYEKLLKAYIQYYNNGLIDNNWYSYSITNRNPQLSSDFTTE